MEQICRELGISERTEHNEGRIYIDLTGGQAQIPPGTGYHPQYGGQQHYYDQYGAAGGSPAQQQQQNYGGGRQNQNDELEEAVKKSLPKIIRVLKSCCVVM